MSTTYVNPDAPNPEVTDAAVRSMLIGKQQSPYSTTQYYAGGYAQNPFATSQNVTPVPSNDSRANIGLPTAAYPYQVPQPQVYACPPTQSQIAPAWTPGMSQINPYITQQPTLQYLQPQPVQPVGGYAGYPIGIEPGNYIFEYMKANAAPKNTWGENFWTAAKPIDPPQIDWTQKQPQYGENNYYAQYGMTPTQYAYGQQQPMLPQGFAFAPVQETLLDRAQKNWNL